MPVHPEFEGPLLRVERAKHHIAELERAQEAFHASHPFAVFDERNEQGQQVFRVRAVKLPSPALGPIVHDILANLRSSLDIAVCAGALAMGAKNLEHTYFHFASSEDQWNKSYKGRTKAAPLYVVHTMRRFAPWAGGNELLYALSKVAVADKHKLVTPIGVFTDQTFKFTATTLEPDSEFFLCPDSEWDHDKRQRDLVWVKKGRIKITEPVVAACFVFGKVDASAAGKPLIPVLHAMSNMCHDIIGQLDLSVGMQRQDGVPYPK